MSKKRIQDSIDTWDTIAESFNHTRQHTWNFCIAYIKTLPSNSFNADFGCGNGRHLLPLANHSKHAIGLDISERLLSIIQKTLRQNEVSNTSLVQGDLCQLPFISKSLDHIIYIAALHNIRKKRNRLQSLRELYRVLKPNGTALISVWSKDQKRFKNKHISQNKHSEPGDVLIYWRQHNLNIPRFYHLYQKEEFKQELQETGFLIKSLKEAYITSKTSADNYYAIVGKS